MKSNKIILIILSIIIIVGFLQLFFPQKEAISQEAQFIELSNGKIAYKEFGEGTSTIILIHGSPGYKESLYALASQIKNHKIYVLDMYGFGQSEKNVKNYGIESASDVIKEFMDKKAIDKTSIAGYSWGGGVAENFAYLYPKNTNYLILISGMGIQEGEATLNYYTEHLRYLISYPFVIFYPSSFYSSYEKRKGFMRSFMDSDQRTIRSKLQSITSPAIIIHGKNDTVIPPKIAEEHQALLNNSEIFYLDGGHRLIYDIPNKVAEIINKNLK